MADNPMYIAFGVIIPVLAYVWGYFRGHSRNLDRMGHFESALNQIANQASSEEILLGGIENFNMKSNRDIMIDTARDALLNVDPYELRFK